MIGYRYYDRRAMTPVNDRKWKQAMSGNAAQAITPGYDLLSMIGYVSISLYVLLQWE